MQRASDLRRVLLSCVAICQPFANQPHIRL